MQQRKQKRFNAGSTLPSMTLGSGLITNRGDLQFDKACAYPAVRALRPVREPHIQLSASIIRIHVHLARVETASDLDGDKSESSQTLGGGDHITWIHESSSAFWKAEAIMKLSGMTFWQSPLELPGVQKACASDSAVDTSSSVELVERAD